MRRLADAWVHSGGSLDSISVWVFDDSTINAASVGDGAFVLWRGLEQLPNDEIDVIYAHEIAHDQLQHARKVADVADVTNFVGDALGTLSGSEEGATATLKRWSGAFVVPRYSRLAGIRGRRARGISARGPSVIGTLQPPSVLPFGDFARGRRSRRWLLRGSSGPDGANHSHSTGSLIGRRGEGLQVSDSAPALLHSPAYPARFGQSTTGRENPCLALLAYPS